MPDEEAKRRLQERIQHHQESDTDGRRNTTDNALAHAEGRLENVREAVAKAQQAAIDQDIIDTEAGLSELEAREADGYGVIAALHRADAQEKG